MKLPEITDELINSFLEGKDPQRNIVSIECGYQDKEVLVISKKNNQKVEEYFDFHPFVWATQKASAQLYKGDKNLIRQMMSEYHIGVKGLNIYDKNGNTTDRLERGYRVLFYAKNRMSYNRFMTFFKQGGTDIYNDPDRGFLCLSPVEQYMIHSGKRQFKGIEDYDELTRMLFDLETQGLDPRKHRITKIGVRTNRNFEYVIDVKEDDKSEIDSIKLFLEVIKDLNPDVIAGHNSENFDWQFIMTRCEVMGYDFKEICEDILEYSIYKKKRKTVLKLGGEIEYFNKTVIPHHTVIDSLHAARRAQAIDSNMKSANLKYLTQYTKQNKDNRVYIPGNLINVLLYDTENKYAFNNENGEYYKIDENNPIKEGYEEVTGFYIVDRYLKDDLYETDKVELVFNQQNFLLSKILPVPFEKVCTMGTASIWKSIMLAWSYENDLAIPFPGKSGKFTGGLSRLLKVGYVDKIVKLDFNSLYPSITISWEVTPDSDISGVMLKLLEYMLSEREKFKAMMKKAKKEANKIQLQINEIDNVIKELLDELKKYQADEKANDKKQIVAKITSNAFFGSFGSPSIFYWGELSAAENITCIGRQSLRLMNKWFKDRGFEPIVMDTDGVNFSYRNVEDIDIKTYIGKGLNRNTELGKEYKGLDAYVAEFNDLFMRGKMGLGLDEIASVSINYMRKTYCDKLYNSKTGEYETKKVGNSIKSKKMPVYIEKFIDKAIDLQLDGKGYEFLNDYYEYIEKIYNGNIPIREICSKGKIKKTIDEYKVDCQTLTSAGNKKARQAWYELCIKHGLNPNMGETIYYLNIGDKKGDGDVKREKIYQTDENGKYVYVDVMDENGNPVLTKKGKPKKEKVVIGEEIKLNCILVPSELIENDADLSDLGDSELNDIEYNVAKYIEQFNNRIKPLLVCFSPDIRQDILIKNPDDRKYFTEEQAQLVSGYPNKPEDQDTYEQLMTMEQKEVKFWVENNKIPPFLEETGMNWDEIVSDYKETVEKQKQEGVQIEISKFNEIISKLEKDDIDDIIETAELPSNITDFLKLDSNLNFISKEFNVQIGTIYDIIDKEFIEEKSDEITNNNDIE